MEGRPEGLDGERPGRLLRFDEFRVDPEARLLWRGEEPVPLTPKVFAVLLALLESPGRVVPKEELLLKVWPDSIVTEANLTQSISTLRKALGERAGDRRYVVTVPGQGYSFAGRIIESAAEPPPAVSAASAASAASPLSSEPSLPAPEALHGWRERRQLELLAAAALLAVAVLAAWVLLVRLPGEPDSEKAAGPGRRLSIAVLGFRNLSGRGQSQWLSAAIPEMLTTELAVAREVRVIPGENVARARLPADPLDEASLRRIHESLGADLLVSGSYLPLGDRGGRRVRLDVRVLRLPGGEPLVSLAEIGTEPELFELVSRTGARLREAIGVSGISPQLVRAVRALLPASPEAARLYTLGLERLHAFDPSGARELLERAADADPRSAVVRSALSQAWADLGHDTRALEEARRAVDLARSLPQTERLAIQARFHVINKEWGKASEIYRSLWTFYPDDLEYGLQLATGLAAAGRGNEALATVAGLRELPPPARDDPRIDLAEAAAAQLVADQVTQKRAAEAAAAKGRRSGADLVVAQSLLHQGEALLRTGSPALALALFAQASERFERAGDRMGIARALTRMGVALHEQGDLKGAEAHYRRALDLAEGIGSVSLIAMQRANLGMVFRDRGDLRLARQSLEQARALHAQSGDRVREARALTGLGTVLWAEGNLADARAAFEGVLEITRVTGNRRDQAKALIALGMTLARQGRLGEARQRQEQALELLQEDGDPALAAAALAESAGVLMRQGDLDTARRQLDQALAIKRQSGDRLGVAEVLDTRAALALATGDLAAAGRLVNEQIRIARELGARTLEAKALRRRAALQRASGDLEAARRSLDEALAASLRMGEELQAADLRLDLASLALARGRPEEAGRLASEAARWYASKELTGQEGQALALLAETLVRQGKAGQARDAAARARARLEGSEDRGLLEILRNLRDPRD